jgi:hypothetical protein
MTHTGLRYIYQIDQSNRSSSRRSAASVATFNAYLPRQIGEPLKKKNHHEPPGQRKIYTRFRRSEPPQQTADAARHSPERERTRTEQIVLTPTGHDVAKIDR